MPCRLPWRAIAGTDLVAVDVVVVAAVGEQGVGLAAGTADPASDRRDRARQGQEGGDVVAVAAGQQKREGAISVGDHVVFRAGPVPVDRRGARLYLPFNALT
jgi:hypothetical protein